MNDDIFKIDLLGNLKIDEIFLYYEEPQLFSCISAFGQKYLGLLTDIDNREWLLVPVSSSRLALLKANKITIKESIINAEDEFVWKITEKSDKQLKMATQVYLDNINDDDLPDEDLYLDCDNEYMPTIDDDIINVAVEEKRDIVDFSILPFNSHVRELEFHVLGEVLINVQQVIYSLALDKDFNGNRISSKIKEENTLSAAGTYAASFGIRAKSNKLSDLYEETPLTNSIKQFSKLLSAKKDKQELKNLLKEMNPRVTMRYKKMMECLFKENLSFNISLASPDKYYFKAEFSDKDIENNLSFLSEEIDNTITCEEIKGKLVGINVNKKRFAFETFDDEIITGIISDDLVKSITFKVPIDAKATLEKETILSDLTDEERYKYRLINIVMLNE